MRLQQRNSQKPNSLNPMMTTYTRRCMKIRKWRVMKTERRYPQFSHQWMDNGGSVLSKSLKKIGSSGRTRTYNPPVNSLVRFRNFNNFVAPMTTHEDAQIQPIYAI